MEEETVVSSQVDFDQMLKAGRVKLNLAANRHTLRINRKSESCEEKFFSEIFQNQVTACEETPEKPRVLSSKNKERKTFDFADLDSRLPTE